MHLYTIPHNTIDHTFPHHHHLPSASSHYLFLNAMCCPCLSPMEITATAISDQSNKENIPPFVCNNTKKGKNLIPHVSPSFKSNNVTKRRAKRIPLADITHLFNESTTTSTFTLAREQQFGVSAIPSASLPRSGTPVVPRSKTLRMGFR